MTQTNSIGRNLPWRLIGWGAATLMLLLPLAGGAPWTLSDFVAMGMTLLVLGLGIELAVRLPGDPFYRAAAMLAVATSVLLLLVNLAVGFLGSEANPANVYFAALPVIALAGALLGNFHALAMARAMAVTAAAQVAIGVTALAAGWAAPGFDGIYEVALGTSMFTGLWLTSAWLFARAARRARATTR